MNLLHRLRESRRIRRQEAILDGLLARGLFGMRRLWMVGVWMRWQRINERKK